MTTTQAESDLERGIDALRSDNYAEARALLRPLAEGGDVTAQYYMGRVCSVDCGDGPPDESVSWLRQAIAGGCMEAAYELGCMFRYWEEDFGAAERAEAHDLLQRAARYFEAAAEAGDPRAQCRFGKMLVRGEGVAKDRERGLNWWRKGAPTAGTGWQGGLASQLWWGEDEDDVTDLAEAVQWLERAAAGGDSGAAYHLGAHYATGDELPQDLAKAVYWYEVSARLGNMEAVYNLGCMYCDGEGVPIDRDYGRKLLIEAGEGGDWNALLLLKDAYRDGFMGFPKDEERAEFWRSEYARVVGERPQKTSDGTEDRKEGDKPAESDT